MEDAAKATSPARTAPSRKTIPLDRIATSDGFKDAKAHQERGARRRRPPRTPRPQKNLRPRIRRRRSADDPSRGQPRTPCGTRRYAELVVSKERADAHVGALVDAANETPGRRPRRRSDYQCRRRFTRGEARGPAVPRRQRLAPL